MGVSIGPLSQGGDRLGIGNLPGRKNPALYVVRGNCFWPLATFRSAEDARVAEDFFTEMAKAGARLTWEDAPPSSPNSEGL